MEKNIKSSKPPTSNSWTLKIAIVFVETNLSSPMNGRVDVIYWRVTTIVRYLIMFSCLQNGSWY